MNLSSEENGAPYIRENKRHKRKAKRINRRCSTDDDEIDASSVAPKPKDSNGLIILLCGRYSRLKKYFRDIVLEELYIFNRQELVDFALPRDKILMTIFIEKVLKEKIVFEK